MAIDWRQEFFEEEILKLRSDYAEKGLSLLIIGDWYCPFPTLSLSVLSSFFFIPSCSGIGSRVLS
jgi:hypothetical protein